MPTATARRLDTAYRQRLAAIRDLLVAQIRRDYAQVTPDDIRGSFAAFADTAIRRIEAGQATVQTMAQAYIRGFIRAETAESIETAALPSLVGENSEGMSLRSVVEPIGWMILGQIGDGKTPEDAISAGEYFISRLADNEVTAVADKVVDEQSDALDDITGWEGIVSAGACDPCQDNAGVHRLDEPIYRHPGCNCTKVPVQERTPGQTIAERAAVNEEHGAAIESETADIRSDGVASEPGISSFLRGLVDDVIDYKSAMRGVEPPEGGDLAGFENRIKTLASTARKIAMKVRDEHISPADAAASIHDLVRYTFRTTTKSYVSQTRDAVAELLRRGYQVTKWKVSWAENEAYAGINSFWRTPAGYEFEVQFHTAESFVSKELNHAAYEAQRILDRTVASQNDSFIQLDREMASRAANVTRPTNWQDLQDLVGRLTAEMRLQAR